MMFASNDITKLLEEFKSFQIEGFNLFGIGSNDDLPHIVCVTPNRCTAQALQALLEIAKKAHDLPGINGYVTGDAALAPQVLANGHIALAATLIINDDAIFKDGVGVKIEGQFIETGTAGYDEFIDKLRKA